MLSEVPVNATVHSACPLISDLSMVLGTIPTTSWYTPWRVPVSLKFLVRSSGQRPTCLASSLMELLQLRASVKFDRRETRDKMAI